MYFPFDAIVLQEKMYKRRYNYIERFLNNLLRQKNG